MSHRDLGRWWRLGLRIRVTPFHPALCPAGAVPVQSLVLIGGVNIGIMIGVYIGIIESPAEPP